MVLVKAFLEPDDVELAVDLYDNILQITLYVQDSSGSKRIGCTRSVDLAELFERSYEAYLAKNGLAHK